MTRKKKKKKLKKSSDWEATHDVSGRLILLRLEGRLWRWRARSFHCFSNKKPLWAATDPHPPPRWHLGTSSAHKIPPRWHKWISTSPFSTSSTTGQDGFQSDKISNVLRALSHCPLALLCLLWPLGRNQSILISSFKIKLWKRKAFENGKGWLGCVQ